MKYAQGQSLSIFVSLRLTKLDNERRLQQFNYIGEL
jgi:hypothetical protein